VSVQQNVNDLILDKLRKFWYVCEIAQQQAGVTGALWALSTAGKTMRCLQIGEEGVVEGRAEEDKGQRCELLPEVQWLWRCWHHQAWRHCMHLCHSPTTFNLRKSTVGGHCRTFGPRTLSLFCLDHGRSNALYCYMIDWKMAISWRR
jgi:hypothetical protein